MFHANIYWNQLQFLILTSVHILRTRRWFRNVSNIKYEEEDKCWSCKYTCIFVHVRYLKCCFLTHNFARSSIQTRVHCKLEKAYSVNCSNPSNLSLNIISNKILIIYIFFIDVLYLSCIDKMCQYYNLFLHSMHFL